ncbi:MAG: phosphatase PAP2 family protein [Saprospiraceae bacterium]|nr:phosphatase PAP2 family protein [Saprospiraceae bacterium]
MSITKYTHIKYPLICLSVITFLVIQSCEKELLRHAEFELYNYSGTDDDAGTWKPVLLNGPEQIFIDAPAMPTSDSYINEITATKTAIAAMTSENETAVKYWGNNPIIRWNEIARELAAKYNLIPPPNPDGTYTLPDPANPAKFPYFPFAHPPYSSRAYAYLSVAQFDALIATWHYKYKYGRPALNKADATIKQSLPVSDLPSYPSDGAVVGAVSRDILSALFPLEKEYLKAKADELKACLLLSGLHVESDIIAGDSLGRGVAKIFLQRAGSDGMRTAQTPRPISDSIKNAAFVRFGWKWENQESPRRPVGLTPNFGKVRTWNVPDVAAMRPPVPPAIGSVEFNKAADELKDIQKNLTNDQRKIANWWSDGFNTTTPPGHWNKFASDFIVKYKYNPIRSARVLAYMNMAIQDAGIVCWETKYYYHYPRPIEAIPGFKTILGTPNFPAYTSGHSTFSAAASEVLAFIFPEEKKQVELWANEAAESRIYGGIHYRFDSEEGLKQGRKVAEFTISKASLDGAD